MSKQQIYLDYAAATPMAPEVVTAMQPLLTDNFYNPSATYLAGRSAREALELARQSVASDLGCRPAEVIFTAGATEANNLAIHGIMPQYPKAELLVSAIEHESVLAPAEQYRHRLISVNDQGMVLPAELQKAISDDTVLISIMLANNEIGSLQPIKKLVAVVEEVRTARRQKGSMLPLLLHTDAAQAANYLDIHVSRLGVDLLSLNGGKLYGPKQSGALYIRSGLVLTPQITGGGQEFGLRSGTENVAGAVGFVTALHLAQQKRQAEGERVTKLRDEFITDITKIIPSAQLNGNAKHRLANNAHFLFPESDNERLMMQLDEQGIMCAVGSACSASSDEPSHVLSAIGLSESQARSCLRFSFGRQTTTVSRSRRTCTVFCS